MPPTVATLACENCTRRKVKCNKIFPCTRCTHSGLACVPVVRSRRARGRNGGRHSGNEELHARIARLESLAQGFANSAATDEQEHRENPMNHGSSTSSPSIRTQSTAVPHSSSTGNEQRLGDSLWTQLKAEISGIRGILDDPIEEDEPRDGVLVETGGDSNAAQQCARIIFNEPLVVGRSFPHLEQHDIEYLFCVFRQRINIVVKVLHCPTFETQTRHSFGYKDSNSSDAYLETVQAAAFYACFSSLTEDECLTRFQSAKIDLLRKWRATVEDKLARSNFLISDRIETLQALVLYLVRTHD